MVENRMIAVALMYRNHLKVCERVSIYICQTSVPLTVIQHCERKGKAGYCQSGAEYAAAQ